MLIRKGIVAISILSVFVLLFGCKEPDSSDSEITQLKTTAVKDATNGVVYHPSELAILMRKMYDNMKYVGIQINSGVEVSDSLLIGYETIVSAKATNPEEIDDKFYGFANMWVSEVEVMRQNPTIENYNSIMSSCVNCHQSYCPGPIPKIKRLRLVP